MRVPIYLEWVHYVRVDFLTTPVCVVVVVVVMTIVIIGGDRILKMIIRVCVFICWKSLLQKYRVSRNIDAIISVHRITMSDFIMLMMKRDV